MRQDARDNGTFVPYEMRKFDYHGFSLKLRECLSQSLFPLVRGMLGLGVRLTETKEGIELEAACAN